MAQITIDHETYHGDPHERAEAGRARDHDDEGGSDREALRTAVPVTIAFALLLGVVVVAGLALKDMLDFGVWFLSAG